MLDKLHQKILLVMEKSPVFSKARASGLTRALKLITRAFPGFADPIDFTNVTDLIGLYRVQSTIVKCFKVIGSFLVFNIVILRVFISKMLICFHNWITDMTVYIKWCWKVPIVMTIFISNLPVTSYHRNWMSTYKFTS